MESKINSMYDELYKKKQSELEKAKNNSLAELNQQKADGEVEYYNEKNKSSLANVKNVQAIRDYMARNNLLNSGENADAILRNRTDYANDIGRINSDHRQFNNNIERQKSKLNSDYNYDLATAKSDYEAQKQKALLDYQMQQQQLAAAYSRSSGGGYSSGGYSESGITAEEVKAAMSSLNNDFNAYIKAGDTRNARDILFQGLRAYQNGLMTGQDYNNMQRKLTALEDELLKKQTQAVKNSGGKLEYGYRNGKAGWYPA